MSRNGSIAATYATAFRRRTAPNTGITIKMLAHKTGYSSDTLERARDDGTTIAGALIKALDDAFAHFGFPGFLLETYGATASAVSSLSNSAPPASSKPSAAGLGSATIAAAGDAGLSFDRHLWVTHERGVCLASRGHGDFARRFLDLPPTTEADPRRFVIDQLGWVAVTQRSDGSVAVEANPARLNQDAADRVAAWLQERPQTAVRAEFLAPEMMITAAEAAQRIRALHPTLVAGGWESERLPESGITDPAARTLWRAIHDAGIARANFLEIADRIGAVDRCAVFLIGDDITSAHVGSALRVDRAAVVGRPILARRDLDYARRLGDDLLQDREAPSIREMRLDADTFYRRLTFVQPLGRNRWQALTASFDIVTPPGFVLA